ncbi:uncharacterized protein LOC124341323 isoform X1 [Daphnia pulicaria]|uniref:uncharacterized protein LOC124341323 isoform X1 n=2 Tax=Daphnia pulicaria TaxID=35523 RepID=UPI001EE9F697|nr:uncharacterized protein LOC124341323 isoform X1 [Daphnia pulicaria]
MKTCLAIVEPLTETRHQEFIDFIYREFFPREPLALASGLAGKTNPKTIETFVQWMGQGVSLVAIDPESDRIVAGALNCFVNKAQDLFDVDYSCMEEEDRCIWKFLDQLEIGYDIFEQLKVDRGMELVFLCVQATHTGQGLARRLTEETIAVAHRIGMPFIKTNPSTPVTCHLFESLGFETISEMKLVDFLLDNKPAFSHAQPDDITRLCVKQMRN